MWTSQVGPWHEHGARVSYAAPSQTLRHVDRSRCMRHDFAISFAPSCAGEPWFIRRIIDKYHDEAATKGVRIVPCCGYDSIPSDLGTWFVVDHVKKQLGK